VGQLAAGIVLVLAGSLLGIPAVVLLGLALALAEGVRATWSRRGLRGLSYVRSLPRARGVVGDEMPLDLTVWNRSALPLSWVRAVDEASAGVEVRERDLVDTETGSGLVNGWTLAPFERVTRHYHLVARRRGVHSLGPVRLETGDLFARSASVGSDERVDRWLVRPRTVAVVTVEREHEWGGDRRARRGLVEDPTRYAGVRPYQPGDPIRAIHWRATARTGTPVVRRFEPARHREVVVVLDLQTVEGRGWALGYDDDAVETLCVVVASLVRRLRDDGAAVGIAAAGYAGAPRPFVLVPPGSSSDQLGRCLDVLARLGSLPSAQAGRLLTWVLRSSRPGTAFVVVSARDPVSFLPALRRVARTGHPVALVALGKDAAEHAARARAAGIDARSGALDSAWATASRLVVA
jgi:uncharacterized protein (DUF58 family)